IKGMIDIMGTINPDNMQLYRLTYGQSVNPDGWTQIGEDRTTYTPGEPLGQWDTSQLDGLYTLELAVILQSGVRESVTTQVRIDNTPPTVVLAAAEPGRIYRFPDDRSVL